MQTVRDLVAWLAGMALTPKIIVSFLIIGLALLVLVLIWAPQRQAKEDAAPDVADDSDDKPDEPLRWISPPDEERVEGRLLALTEQLSASLPRRQSDNVLIATWNLRNFGSNRVTKRLPESIHYIAQIVSQFDIVALQEIDQNTTDFERLNFLLGDEWSIILSETSPGMAGNNERLGYLYRNDRVEFSGESSNLILPAERLIQDEYQFARPPFTAKFVVNGQLALTLTNSHLYFGAMQGEKYERRLAEAEALAEYYFRRSRSTGYDAENVVVLGDLQVQTLGDQIYEKFMQMEFRHPDELNKPTNVKRDSYYARMFFLFRRDRLRLGFSNPPAGALDWSQSVFRDEDLELYHGLAAGEFEKASRKFEMWRTWQISDHLPLWVELFVGSN